jgi:hypothetical protein
MSAAGRAGIFDGMNRIYRMPEGGRFTSAELGSVKVNWK